MTKITANHFPSVSKPIASGAQIRAGRALLNWTQRELAQAAGLHPKAVAYWERKSSFGGRSEEVGVGRIREALAANGVLVFAQPSPGVRFDADF